MSDFEYLSVLIAIIVGIGFAHLLLSIGRIVGEIKRLNVQSVQLIWTVNILLLLVVFWWWAISLRELEEWVFLQLVFLLFDVSLWCLLAAILYPIFKPAVSTCICCLLGLVARRIRDLLAILGGLADRTMAIHAP